MILTTPHVIITVVRVHKRPLLWYLIGEDWYSYTVEQLSCQTNFTRLSLYRTQISQY